MTVSEALQQAAKRLSSNSSSPRLDAEVLLAHLLGTPRASLLANSQQVLTAKQSTTMKGLIERRTHGEPVAYLTGHKEFYGFDLFITPDVLVPRPETESVVDACLEVLVDLDNSQLADIGTGSGAIAIAVTKHNSRVRASATDIFLPAIEVARRNCERHGVADRVTLYTGHLLQPLKGKFPNKFNVVAANLPYVPPGEASPDVATWEPNVAVFGGGDDGTALIREFLREAPAYLLPGGTVVMETAHSQGALVARLAKRAFPGAEVEVRKDLAGYDRIVVIKTA
ncbi:MAG: peptide chain release factor N(5)-glutamine methyltransferase [Chloroflexia bacterium]